jgi:hypothetical protein
MNRARSQDIVKMAKHMYVSNKKNIIALVIAPFYFTQHLLLDWLTTILWWPVVNAILQTTRSTNWDYY